MQGRGVKYLFSPGESVLCFEPDPSKARVLYTAKVLESAVGRDSCGKRLPEYLIHFQGWNNSWDRIVAAHLVLKDTEENQMLKKKLSYVARKVRGNKNRLKKIDKILRHTLPVDNKIVAPAEDSSDTDVDIDLDDLDTEDTGSMARTSASEEEPTAISDLKKEDNRSSSSSDDGPMFILNIPSVLKKVLENDFNAIQKHKKLMNLPAENTVIMILESYAKDYAISTIMSSGDKGRLHKENSRIISKRNIDICREVMDGIRVLFDFLLQTNLLYDSERDQYEKLINKTGIPVIVKSELVSEADLSQISPVSPTMTTRESRSRTTVKKESTSKMTRISPRSVKKETEPLEVDHMPRRLRSTSDNEVPVPPKKRLTRNSERCKSPDISSFTVSLEKIAKKEAASSLPSSKPSPIKKSQKSAPVRSSRRLHPSASTSSSSDTIIGHENSLDKSRDNTSKMLTSRIIPPAPLNIPSTISSKVSNSDVFEKNSLDSSLSQSSLVNLPSKVSPSKDGSIKDVLAWQMIPDEVYLYTPTPPTLIYGVQHLLRLFVKIPDVISMMNMPQFKRKFLLQHLEQLLQYISERKEELLSKTSYTIVHDTP